MNISFRFPSPNVLYCFLILFYYSRMSNADLPVGQPQSIPGMSAKDSGCLMKEISKLVGTQDGQAGGVGGGRRGGGLGGGGGKPFSKPGGGGGGGGEPQTAKERKAETLAAMKPIEKGRAYMAEALDFMSKSTRFQKTIKSSKVETVYKTFLEGFSADMSALYDELDTLVEKRMNTETVNEASNNNNDSRGSVFAYA